MSAARALQLVRRAARKRGLSVVELHKRGKGSHRMYALVDAEDREIERFGLTDHPGDISWLVLRRLEERLTEVFGGGWMEER